MPAPGPSDELRAAATAAYRQETQRLVRELVLPPNKKGQTHLAKAMAKRAKETGPRWTPSQQSIQQWIDTESPRPIGWNGILAIQWWLGLTDAELLLRFPPKSSGRLAEDTPKPASVVRRSVAPSGD
jgi:hypothetical protein